MLTDGIITFEIPSGVSFEIDDKFIRWLRGEEDDGNNLPFSIVKVEILAPQKVIRCTFSDGDIQKAVCCDEDTFTLEAGISVCITKHLIGGTSKYNKAIKQGVDCYKAQIKAEEERIAKEKQDKRRREKYQAYKKRRDEKRSSRDVQKELELLEKLLERLKEE